MTAVTDLLAWLTVAIAAYFLLFNLTQLAMGVVALLSLVRYGRRRTPRQLRLASQLGAAPLVSIVVPARNEALTVVDSIRALLAVDYPAREIVVVNDGSTDATLTILQRTFELLPAPLAYPQLLATAAVRGIYRSIDQPLVVIDKESGGCKADAANAGINAAAGVAVLVMDADTVLEPDALTRAALPFFEDPEVAVVGGYVAVANGCRIEQGRVTDVAMPGDWLARFQVIEYMRSFLTYRTATAAHNGLAIVSGAFGVFRRQALIDAGGFDRTAIGEDMELTLRLQRLYRGRGQPARIVFAPYPLCWTQVPDHLQSLRSQRCRWRRGLLQALWRHRVMIGNPRFGTLGLAVLPYIVVVEGIGPLLEVSGYGIVVTAALLGALDGRHYQLLLAAAFLYGIAATLWAILLNDLASRHYRRGRELAVLVAAAVLENVGYRQLNAWWSCVGTVQAATGKGGWGTMRRRAFGADA